MNETENLRTKLERVLTMKDGGERLIKKSKNNEQVQSCYKNIVLLERQKKFYESQIKISGDENNIEMIRPIGSGCSASIRLHIPFVTYDNFKFRRSENRYIIHAYIEVICNDEIFQSDLVEIDQNMNEIVSFNISLNDVDPQTTIKFYIYSWLLKVVETKKSLITRKPSCVMLGQNDSLFDLYAIYDSTIIGLARNNLFEYKVINPENVLSNFTEYNKITSAVLFIYPEKYYKIFARNKVVVLTVKEVMNMEEEGDEYSFLTLYWNIDAGCIKFYFDIYLSKCLETLTTPLTDIENLDMNEIENELTITSITHVITLMIENKIHLRSTLEMIEKTMAFGHSWPSNLISYPRSTTSFLKHALTNTHLFFDDIGMPLSRRTAENNS